MRNSPKTFLTLLRAAAQALGKAGIENPAAEAEILFMETLDCSRAALLSHYDEIPSADILERLEQTLLRRSNREPVQYIFGRAYFMNLCLEVTPDVLIPRPETELLVENICLTAPGNASILDLGTGSGAIALAVACERLDVQVTAVDISPAALAVAERNRQSYNLQNVSLLQSNLFSALADRTFDCIAANLPYVSHEEYATLQPEVKNHEPQLALTADDSGLAVIRRAAEAAPSHL
ncbi:MAG: peptide chain release factor N(5)-glutamine methyltransferase, partial [Victivallaceae bacterium]